MGDSIKTGKKKDGLVQTPDAKAQPEAQTKKASMSNSLKLGINETAKAYQEHKKLSLWERFKKATSKPTESLPIEKQAEDKANEKKEEKEGPAEKEGAVKEAAKKPGFLQRGYFAVRDFFKDSIEDKIEGFRNAVDERNEHYEDYKKTSKWNRFKWAARHPIAWMFGRTKPNQKKTEERVKRRNAIDAFWSLKNPTKAVEQPEESGEEKEAEAASDVGEELEETLLKGTDNVTSTVSDSAGSLAGILGEFKANKVQTAGTVFGTMGGVSDAVATGVGLYKSIKGIRDAAKIGDKKALGSSIYETGKTAVGGAASAIDTVNGFLDVTQVGQAASGLNMIKSGVEIAKGAYDLKQAVDVKKNTAKLQEEYAQAAESEDLSDEERERINEMSGLLQMAHNTAKVKATKEGIGIAANVMSLAGSSLSMAGVPVGGTVLGLASMATNKIGDAVTDRMNKNYKREIVNQDLNLDAEIANCIQMFNEDDKGKEDKDKLNLTPKEAERLVLRQKGFSSIEEAYLTIAKRRKTALDTDKDKGRILEAMKLKEGKAKDEDIYQSMGVSESYSKDIDKGIQSEREIASKPEFQRMAEEPTLFQQIKTWSDGRKAKKAAAKAADEAMLKKKEKEKMMKQLANPKVGQISI